ncbi:MAG TPA: hypothetical protein PLL50_03255 [Propionicimonas sp.]|nr:hypothetical protein [Propionicimonas sp.]HQA77357.1 hypothetical protein [Propionicimonas sp.]HQD97077.1 hypothetical protein [Propionicimonas sp.]
MAHETKVGQMHKAAFKLAGLVAGTVALVGCAGGNPTVAAYVGAETISQAKVDGVARVLADATADATDTAGGYGQTVVAILVQSKLAAQAAATKGITVSDAERQQVYDSNELYTVLLNNPATADFMREYANTAVIFSTEEGKAGVNELLGKTTITVNPRLGTWDAAMGGVVQGSTGSLSELASAK